MIRNFIFHFSMNTKYTDEKLKTSSCKIIYNIIVKTDDIHSQTLLFFIILHRF